MKHPSEASARCHVRYKVEGTNILAEPRAALTLIRSFDLLTYKITFLHLLSSNWIDEETKNFKCAKS